MTRRPPRKSKQESSEKRSFKKKTPFACALLDSIDESPEFHDPYSELNLFLSQKIKQEMRHCSNSKKWSLQLQDELLNKITPQFQKEFPKYRLGICALKKTWEKIHYFSTQIQGEKKALTQDGKLNIPFFIKENLKTSNKLNHTCHLHPYHYAHQLAVKMSECIAIVDGIRPKLDQLTRTIWSLQKHLIPELAPEHFKSPYDENDNIDKLIVKIILEVEAKLPAISQSELEYYVQKKIHQLKMLTNDYTPHQINKMLTAILADQMHLPSQRMEKTLEQIPYPIAKCFKNELATILIDAPHLAPKQAVEEALAFFQKAKSAINMYKEEEITRKMQTWTIQRDMLLRWIRLNHSSSLFREIESIWVEKKPTDLKHLVSQIHKQYLEKFPHLIAFARDLEKRTWIFVKYIWYTQVFEEKTPTYDRFIKWHKDCLKGAELSPTELMNTIEKHCKKMLPLMPFNRARAHTVVFTEEENYSHQH